jgi:hypothetical protein
MKVRIFVLLLFITTVLGFSQESENIENPIPENENDRYIENPVPENENNQYTENLVPKDENDLYTESPTPENNDDWFTEDIAPENDYNWFTEDTAPENDYNWFTEDTTPENDYNWFTEDTTPENDYNWFTGNQTSNRDDEWFVGKPIRDITFSGLRHISLPEIDALMQPYKGRIFDDMVFWEIQGKLYALEYFERIDPTTVRANTDGSEVIIRFNVTERPIVGRIIFAGNSGLRNRDISDVITTKVNDIFNQAKVRVDVEAIMNLYIEKGFPNATVDAEENTSRDGSVIVTFRITESEKITISKIEFQGNSRFSNNALRSQLSLKARSLLNKGAFQEASLIADREAVAKYYHDRGYIDAVVRDVTRTYDTDKKGTNLTLTFWIDEGSEFTFNGVTFSGNIIFTSEQLENLITSKTGEIVNSTKLEMDLQRVSDLYY